MRKTGKRRAVRSIATRVRRRAAVEAFILPTEARTPETDPDRYAYLITGEKKIGKTSWAIEGCREIVLQFDKPQLAYAIVEVCPTSWSEVRRIVSELEARAAADDFPYQRVVVDGVNEMYAQCVAAACKPLGVSDPGEMDDYGKTWRKVKAEFKDVVNRLLRLQVTARCGLVFIAHAAWKTHKRRGGGEVERLEADVSTQVEEIVGGKVDGWFTYVYDGSDRVLIVRGDEETSGGHRIDGHFVTVDGRQVREVPMGSSPREARAAFVAAFENKQRWADMREWRAQRERKSTPAAGRKRRRGRPRQS